MGILDTIKTIWKRRPIEGIPVDFNHLGYRNPGFERYVESPAFAGWPGDRPDEEEVAVILKMLKPKAGSRLLDVACGYGRHALPLAARGISVTGTDFSPALIARAARSAVERGIKAEFSVQDARKLAWNAEFDLAMIAFNSFGLFSPQDAPEVLKGIRRALRPGGRLFMDLPARRPGVEYPERQSHWQFDRGRIKLQEVSFRREPLVEISRDLYIDLWNGEVEEFMIYLRLFSLDEIGALLAGSGFRIEEVRGDWSLGAMLSDSRKIILTARRD